MSTAYVLVEYDGDQVLPITGELITAAKVFESVTAVVVGPAGAHEPLVPQLAALGADAIVAAVGADTAQRVVLPAADALGGAVGATRDVVDLGWYDPIYQIGQTGVTVSPDVYIGLGVSGAIQHTSGMQTAKKIIVINNDEDAPFFHIADLGVVGDLHEIVPLIVEELAKRK